MNPIQKVKHKLSSGDKFLEEIVDDYISRHAVQYAISIMRKKGEILTYLARDKNNKRRYKYRLKGTS